MTAADSQGDRAPAAGPAAPEANSRAEFALHAPAPSPRPRSRSVWIAAVAVVLAVALVLALVLTGVLTLSRSVGDGTQTFSSSRNVAQSTANGATGGPWSLLVVVGLATHASYTSNAANLTVTASSLSQIPWCTLSGSSGASASVTASTVGDVGSGSATVWLYLFTNTSGAMLLVTVTGGSATVIGTLSGHDCNPLSSGFSLIPSTGLIDSTTAFDDAGAAGGLAFLAAHPGANATLLLRNSDDSLVGATWEVEYLNCALSGSGPVTAPAFYAAVSATTGDILRSQSTIATCPATSATPGLASLLGFGAFTYAASGSAFWYNISVQTAIGPVSWSETSLSIHSSSQILSTPLAVASVVNDGRSLANFTFLTGVWSGLSSSGISEQDILCLYSPTSVSGQLLVVTATASYSGAVTVDLS